MLTQDILELEDYFKNKNYNFSIEKDHSNYIGCLYVNDNCNLKYKIRYMFDKYILIINYKNNEYIYNLGSSYSNINFIKYINQFL